jgi:hypothetical protein
VLREAGLIRQHDEGTRRLNRLRRDDLDARFPGLLDLITAHSPPTRRPPRKAAGPSRVMIVTDLPQIWR